ncbi:mitochondrial carrier domain-containing protein [Massariosphaeria phaeospora]|uniref:Mitochondrial carrier domain-containing protein n=1 Tax=Massariosphaeria phaeospora TaxID=100035 RepID=A0A7C8M7D9_9PLEO|nr:mitochondrial carrier domain-containing protein [Massariosphaeria phaeospora]
MATSRDAPNPLRPYYIPPSIGLPPDTPHNHTSSARSSKPGPSFGSQARDILSDIDYDSYFDNSSPGVTQQARRIFDQALWNYTSVLLAQPFEVAKTILQVHLAGQAPPGLLVSGDELKKSRPSSFASGKYEDYPSDESDEDSPGYFTSTAPRRHNPPHSPTASTPRSPERRRSQHAPSRSGASTPTQAASPTPRKLELRKSDSLLEVIAQVWQKESAWGVWKGSNATFIYNFLLKTTEGWTRGMLSALLNMPDPSLIGSIGGTTSGIGGLDIIDSPSPLLSLAVAVTATAIAATLLAPLDLVRTRLIVSPTSAPPRTIYPSLSLLPSLIISPSLVPVTLLHATIPTVVSTSTPVVLRGTLGIDPILTPSYYTISTFLSSSMELFLRLPLETVLRRGQVAVLQEHENQRLSAAYRHPQGSKSAVFGMENEDLSVRSFKTIVEPGPYKGLFGSIWFIVREEGVQVLGPGAAKAAAQQQSQARTPSFSARTRVRKGQGVHGLWRGWRVGFWGLVGVWGAAAMGAGGGEF